MTGTEGMIGSRLCKWLSDKGHTVTQFQGDITVYDNWQKYYDRNFDFLIHLAALAGVRESFNNPEKYYEAKRIFHRMINSEKYMINFRLPEGGLIIMDNYRLLHGRTSFNTSEGSRFLQGLYIDHDSIESKYKILKKNIYG